MNFNESIALNTYSDNANKQFNEMQSRLSELESSFQTRMSGKTTGGLVGSLVGNVCWLVAFVVCAIMVRYMVDGIILAIALIAVIGLMIVMIADTIMNSSYYGKISGYKSSVSQLQNRVSVGKNSIKSNHDAFLSSKAKGWNYLLAAGSSIPEEAASIETTMTNMESLKTGFINSAKNVFYYAAVVAITITGCVALFPVGGEIMSGISGAHIASDTIMILNVIAMIITGVGEVILAKLAWSKTDCAVTNTTLFAIVLGPIAFLVLIAIATLLVELVLGIVQIIVYIIGIVFVGAVVLGSLCGG